MFFPFWFYSNSHFLRQLLSSGLFTVIIPCSVSYLSFIQLVYLLLLVFYFGCLCFFCFSSSCFVSTCFCDSWIPSFLRVLHFHLFLIWLNSVLRPDFARGRTSHHCICIANSLEKTFTFFSTSSTPISMPYWFRHFYSKNPSTYKYHHTPLYHLHKYESVHQFILHWLQLLHFLCKLIYRDRFHCTSKYKFTFISTFCRWTLSIYTGPLYFL